ncbi:MAG TPA: hypothetical protein VLV50_04980 [Stellaceae bacterium]|nr:hypothetical protein [Stellaceae bacterium]
MPAVAKGATIAKGAKLDVPAQGRVVLISDAGQVVTINGPFSGPPPAPNGPGVPGDRATHVLSALLNHTQTELGVARAVESHWRDNAVATPADVYAIDASDGGDICLADPAHAVVMHDPAAAGDMSVKSLTGDGAAKLTWTKGAVRQAWPASFQLADGDMVSFEMAGQDVAAIATIHILPSQDPGGDVARAMALAQAGCTDQARLLLGVIAKKAK